MNSRKIIQGLSVIAIAVTCASAAFAEDEYGYTAPAYNQPVTQVPIAKLRSENAPLGVSAQEMNVDRTIKVNTTTKYLNVKQGEVVAVVNGDKAFAWKFDTLGSRPFKLAQIAPQDFGAGNVIVYVNDAVQMDD